MTLIEAINRIDLLKPNTYTQLEKIRWLSTLDGKVFHEIISTHEGAAIVGFEGYGAGTPVTTPLLIPTPYDEIYLYWLEAQIDYWNGEYDKYNNSISMYHAALSDYESFYHDGHPPKSKGRFRF